MADEVTTPPAATQKPAKPALKPLADAVKEVPAIDPKAPVDNSQAFAVYRKHYAGHESEVSFESFLSAHKKQNPQPAK